MTDWGAKPVCDLHLGDALIYWTKSLNWAKLCLVQDLTEMKKWLYITFAASRSWGQPGKWSGLSGQTSAVLDWGGICPSKPGQLKLFSPTHPSPKTESLWRQTYLFLSTRGNSLGLKEAEQLGDVPRVWAGLIAAIWLRHHHLREVSTPQLLLLFKSAREICSADQQRTPFAMLLCKSGCALAPTSRTTSVAKEIAQQLRKTQWQAAVPHLQHHQPVSKRCQIPRKFTCPAEHPHRLQELLPQPKLQSPHHRAKGAWGSTPRTSAGTRDKVLATLSEASQAGSSSPRSPPLPTLLSSLLPPPPARLPSPPVPPPAGSVTCSARRPPHGRGERCRCRPRRQPRMLRSAPLLSSPAAGGSLGPQPAPAARLRMVMMIMMMKLMMRRRMKMMKREGRRLPATGASRGPGLLSPPAPAPGPRRRFPSAAAGRRRRCPGESRAARPAPLRTAPARPDPPRSDPRGFPRPCAGGRARSAPIRSSPSRRRLPRQLSGLPWAVREPLPARGEGKLQAASIQAPFPPILGGC